MNTSLRWEVNKCPVFRMVVVAHQPKNSFRTSVEFLQEQIFRFLLPYIASDYIYISCKHGCYSYFILGLGFAVMVELLNCRLQARFAN